MFFNTICFRCMAVSPFMLHLKEVLIASLPIVSFQIIFLTSVINYGYNHYDSCHNQSI